MSETVRFGVSLSLSLLDEFDGLIKKLGYESRSEAVRDLIRQKLVQEEYAKQESKKQNASWIAARNRATARPMVSKFDQGTRRLCEEIERLECEIERLHLAILVATGAGGVAEAQPLPSQLGPS